MTSSNRDGGGNNGGSATAVPVIEVVGSEENIAIHGSPIDNREQVAIRYHFYPTWRSQVGPLIGFFITSLLSIIICDSYEWLIISGPLFETSEAAYFMNLPLPWFLPAFLLGRVLIRIYDARYIVDSRGVEAQVGLLSMHLIQPRLRFEDIRGVEPSQTIWQRLLGIGDISIGSAMRDDAEVIMQGVANPRGIQLLISSEIEKRLQTITGQGTSAGGSMLVAKGD